MKRAFIFVTGLVAGRIVVILTDYLWHLIVQDLSDIADSLSSQLETVAALNSGLAPGLNGPQHPGGHSPAAARNKLTSSAHAQSSSDNSEFQSKKTSNVSVYIL